MSYQLNRCPRYRGEFLERLERALEPRQALRGGDVAQIPGRDRGHQLKPDIGGRRAVRDRIGAPFLIVVRNEPVVARGDHLLEESPRQPRGSAKLPTSCGVEDRPPILAGQSGPIRQKRRDSPTAAATGRAQTSARGARRITDRARTSSAATGATHIRCKHLERDRRPDVPPSRRRFPTRADASATPDAQSVRPIASEHHERLMHEKRARQQHLLQACRRDSPALRAGDRASRTPRTRFVNVCPHCTYAGKNSTRNAVPVHNEGRRAAPASRRSAAT